jgi:hypothetical protein
MRLDTLKMELDNLITYSTDGSDLCESCFYQKDRAAMKVDKCILINNVYYNVTVCREYEYRRGNS